MDSPPPISVCFSVEDVHRDDHSELTESCHGLDDLLRGEGDFGLRRAADPYYYHTLNGSPAALSQTPGNEDLAEMKMDIVRKQETIDALSSKLSQCEVDIEVLKAEKSALVNKLAAGPSVVGGTQPPQEWFFSNAADDDEQDDNGASSLREENAKLTADISRLQVAADVLRKSFRSYVKDSRRVSAEHWQTIHELRQENAELRREQRRQQLRRSSRSSGGRTPATMLPPERKASGSSHFTNLSQWTPPTVAEEKPPANNTLSVSDRTGRTCLLDASDVTLPQLGVPLSALRSMALSESEMDDEEGERRTEEEPPRRAASSGAAANNHASSSAEEIKEELLLGRARRSSNRDDRSDLIRVLRVTEERPTNECPPGAEEAASFVEDPMAGDGDLLPETAGDLVVDFGKARRTTTTTATMAARRRNSLPEKKEAGAGAGAARRNHPRRGALLVDFGETPRRPKRTFERWHSFKW